jgi:hypothetical protein
MCFSRRKLVRTGIPQFMAARALAVTGGSFREALRFVHDNIDQPAEFWQPESERHESRPLSMESQLLCSRLQSGPSSSDALGTADTVAGDVLRFEELRLGDCVLVDAASCNQAVQARIKKHEFAVTEPEALKELLPPTVNLPKWCTDDGNGFSAPAFGLLPHQSDRQMRWMLTLSNDMGPNEGLLGSVAVECTLPLAFRRWEDNVDESMDFRIAVLRAADLFPTSDISNRAAPLSELALARLARIAPSGVVLPFDCVQQIRARRGWRPLQSALSAASNGIRAIFLECGSSDVPDWLDPDARNALGTLLVVSFRAAVTEHGGGNAALGRQECMSNVGESWAEGSMARLSVATEPYTLVFRPFGAAPKCDSCSQQITGPCAFKKNAVEIAGAFGALLPICCLSRARVQMPSHHLYCRAGACRARVGASSGRCSSAARNGLRYRVGDPGVDPLHGASLLP